MPRRYFIGGNWKSNGTVKANQQLIDALNKTDIPSNTDVVIAPVFIHILQAQQSITNKSISIAAQNCSQYKQGAYTGEVTADQLTDIGLKYVILGHSERRQKFGESDKIVAEKIKIALANNLNVIACLGETLEQRDAKKQDEIVTSQLDAFKGAVSSDQWSRVVIAYEPVWAIGTGKNASNQQAQEMHQVIRQWLSKHVSEEVAKSTRVIYGGSVKGSNAGELIAEQDIDGFLVGGASLKADDFGAIIASTGKKQSKL